MLDTGIIFEPRTAHLFRSQWYETLSDTQTATQEAVYLGPVRESPHERGYETPEAELFQVKGLGEQDGVYRVETWRVKGVLEAYVSEARRLTQPLPERENPIPGQEDPKPTYYRREVKVPPKKQSKRLKPDTPLYGTLEIGVRRQLTLDALVIK